jgi:hypothetical protein
MSAAAALTISPEVEKEIAVLKSGDPRLADVNVIDLRHAREKNKVRKNLKELESLIREANANLLAFRHSLRGTLSRIEEEWSRSEVAIYRGAFVDCVQQFELNFAKSLKQFEDAKVQYEHQITTAANIHDVHSRRFIRNTARSVLDIIDDRITQQNRMINFMRSDFLSRMDRRLLDLNEPMSLEESVADVTARYPKVLEYLAQ